MRLFAALIAFAFIAVSVKAAENAERGTIGFSPDGRYFAFEQYGVQDGSGFPYSEIFVVDLDANTWVKGSPVRETLQSETALVSEVRARAAKSAGALLAKFRTAEPGELLASQPPTEASGDRHRLSFDAYYESRSQQPADAYSLSLELVPFAAPDSCYAEDGKQMGFRLAIAGKSPETATEIHRDQSIPASRHCPRDYDIADVIAYRSPSSGDRHVAMIGIYTPGFEGLNRRFLAVPFALP
jgi:predicted secreted protein